MADNIVATAAFGQKKDDNEEEPIIVAQRFLNIFRQLHIFSSERKEAFNKMLLELPSAVRRSFKTLPGGSVLLDYIGELEKKNSITHGDDFEDDDGGNPNVLQTAVSENKVGQSSSGGEIINSDNFAKILANSLAQSNAQIIRELQNNRRPEGKTPIPSANAVAADSGPLKLIADETFTKTISEALAQALANSEKKRLEDNKLITQSFMELQENLNKMVEQNAQLKIISNSDAPAEAASAFQIKNVVDDLVKAQSKFLKETTQSQKEEISSAISVAIKESLKMSTQSLVDGFKQMEKTSPAPITYAAASPKNQGGQNVEEILKAQGKEFSSIIAQALRESQQNSAQAIIKTIETLKNAPDSGGGSPRVEEIMKMQAELFRDIARAQSQEFSTMIANALQESQKQSTRAIIEALGQVQPQAKIEGKVSPVLQTDAIMVPDKDYGMSTEEDDESLLSGKKKKKKKKKNRNLSALLGVLAPDKAEKEDEEEIKEEPVLLSEPKEPESLPEEEQPLLKASTTRKTIVSALPQMPEIEDKPFDNASDWGFGSSISESSSNSSAKETNSEWNWEYQPEPEEEALSAAEEFSGEEGQDWEWEYEEVPENGVEGQDWEWEYEEIPAESTPYPLETPPAPSVTEIVETSEIVLPDNFEILLIGMEDDKYQDPYLENMDAMI